MCLFIQDQTGAMIEDTKGMLNGNISRWGYFVYGFYGLFCYLLHQIS